MENREHIWNDELSPKEEAILDDMLSGLPSDLMTREEFEASMRIPHPGSIHIPPVGAKNLSPALPLREQTAGNDDSVQS
jgi:hypothetical protein